MGIINYPYVITDLINRLTYIFLVLLVPQITPQHVLEHRCMECEFDPLLIKFDTVKVNPQ